MGNLPELGAWNHNQAIQMFQENNTQDASLLFDSKNNSECYSSDNPTEAGDNVYHEIDK